jgi:hypothetical protein
LGDGKIFIERGHALVKICPDNSGKWQIKGSIFLTSYLLFPNPVGFFFSPIKKKGKATNSVVIVGEKNLKLKYNQMVQPLSENVRDMDTFLC